MDPQNDGCPTKWHPINQLMRQKAPLLKKSVGIAIGRHSIKNNKTLTEE